MSERMFHRSCSTAPLIRRAAAAVMVAMCAVAPHALRADTTAHKNGYLQDYHRLGHVGGVPIEQVWIHPELDLQDYKSVYIAPIQVDPLAARRKGQTDYMAATRLAGELRLRLTSEMQGLGIFDFVSTDPYFSQPRRGYLVLEMRITEAYSGNAGLRRYVGFGAGATEIQLEGKLIEARTCRTLFEFADRRLHPGDALIMGGDKSKAGEYLMGIDLKMMMDGILKLFIYLREEGSPANQR